MKASLWAAAVAASLSGCFLCLDPWHKYPRRTPPDEAYSVGSAVAGDDVYSWRCDHGQHVVVIFTSAEMWCSGARREITACGELTAYERAVGPERRHPLRPGLAWPR